MKQTFRIFLLPLLCLAAAACTRPDENAMPGVGDYADVTFTVEMPVHSVPSTRSLTSGGGPDYDENTVSRIHVLVFNSGGNYRGYTTVNSGITQGSPTDGGDTNPYSVKTFKARLKRSANASDTYTFVFLANVDESLISSFNAEGSLQKEDVVNSLELGEAAINNMAVEQTTNYLPMWGEHMTPTEVKSGTTVTDVKLLRMVASIDIVSNDNDYKISEVYLFNRRTKGLLVPASANMDSGKAVAPTPTGSRSAAFPDTEGNGKDFCEGGAVASFTGRLYAFESEYDDNNQHCIVVKLGGQFFRLNFHNGTDGLPLLRNHKYTFTIRHVSGTGASSASEAYERNDAHVEAELKYNHTANYSDNREGETIISSKGYYFSINNTKLQINPFTSAFAWDSAFYLKTNYEGNWVVRFYSDEECKTPMPDFYLSKNRDINSKVESRSGSVTDGLGEYIIHPPHYGLERKIYMKLDVGELSTLVTINQIREGIHAPEGILGVNNKGELNLDGQKYVDGETILWNFIVYFKWGSVIGMRAINQGNIVSQELVWAPSEYDLFELKANMDKTSTLSRWDLIPYNYYLKESAHNYFSNDPEHLKVGLGDPCMLAKKDGNPGGYKMPDGTTWFETLVLEETKLYVEHEKFGPGLYNENRSNFYPAAGYRGFPAGRLYSMPIMGNPNSKDFIGRYHMATSSTLYLNDTHGKQLFFRPSEIGYSHDGVRTDALPIRCIPIP